MDNNKKVGKYLMFCGTASDTHGGMSDYNGSAETIDELKEIAFGDWCEIVDHKTMKVRLMGRLDDNLTQYYWTPRPGFDLI